MRALSTMVCEAIELASRGESALMPSVATKLVAFARRAPARDPKRAATELGLSERESVLVKIGATDRTQATLRARELGIV